jgi:hypothetical protein
VHKKSRGWTLISFSNGNLHNSSREDTFNEGTILLNLVPHITVICWKLDPEKNPIITWLTVTEHEYLCHKWPRICSVPFVVIAIRSFPHS